jgi:translation initiation factor IF-1
MQLGGMKHPEAQFVVQVTAGDEIVCRAPGRAEQRIRMADLGAVYVETNDSGPWGADVWWLLDDITGQTRVAFPQMATGEEAALERLRRLPGFEVRGMNSTGNARFICWPAPAA